MICSHQCPIMNPRPCTALLTTLSRSLIYGGHAAVSLSGTIHVVPRSWSNQAHIFTCPQLTHLYAISPTEGTSGARRNRPGQYQECWTKPRYYWTTGFSHSKHIFLACPPHLGIYAISLNQTSFLNFSPVKAIILVRSQFLMFPLVYLGVGECRSWCNQILDWPQMSHLFYLFHAVPVAYW